MGEKAEYSETNKCKDLERAGNGERTPSNFPPKEIVGLNFKNKEVREIFIDINV